MSGIETARVTVDDEGEVELPERIAEIVEEHRETFELVADGADDSARMAQNILDTAEDENA